MDIFSEISRLPQFLYVFPEREMILGGQSGPDGRSTMDYLFGLWECIKGWYEKPELSDVEKGAYAEAVKKMGRACQSGIINPPELRRLIESLSEKEKNDIVWQIDMYKRGRSYSNYMNSLR